MTTEAPLLFVPVGRSAAAPFGIDARERACKAGSHAGLECANAPDDGRAVLLASTRFAWSPAWLRRMASRPNTVLTSGDEPVMIHVAADANPAAAAAALEDRAIPVGYERLDADSGGSVTLIDRDDAVGAERAIYDATYKQVGDVLTFYVWRGPAFAATRWAATAGLSPNVITAAGAAFCAVAFLAFWHAHYWLGLAAGFLFMFLDTVDGQLARCTAAWSRAGGIADRAIDVIHPPLWYWAWAHGLGAYGHRLEPVTTMMVLLAIIVGYVGQRAVETVFARRFRGADIHAWRPVDSRFRLVTASRGPNMLILLICLVFARPDLGLQLIAWWTIISLIFHAVRLAQATEQSERGRRIKSWLPQ